MSPMNASAHTNQVIRVLKSTISVHGELESTSANSKSENYLVKIVEYICKAKPKNQTQMENTTNQA